MNKLPIFGWFMADEKGRLAPQGSWSLSRAPFNYLAAKFPQAERLVKKFQSRFQEYPDGFAFCGYDSMLAWSQAVRKAGSAQRQAVAQALKGLSFMSLRGQRFIREVDGQLDCPTFFGRLVYQEPYPMPVMESVLEIPASKTWLSEKEVRERRRAAAKP